MLSKIDLTDWALGFTLGGLYALGPLGRQLDYKDEKIDSQSDNEHQSPTSVMSYLEYFHRALVLTHLF